MEKISKFSDTEIAVSKEKIHKYDDILEEKKGLVRRIAKNNDENTVIQERIDYLDTLITEAEILGVKTQAVIEEEIKLTEQIEDPRELGK